MNRRFKQFIYGTFYLLVIFLIFGGVYLSFFASDPTCFDSRRNQNEEGIDCGGACQKICLPPTVRDPQVVYSKFFLLSDSNATLYGEISNLNPDYAVKNFSFSFNAAKSGQSSSTPIVSGNSFIYAADKTYLIFPNSIFKPDSDDKPEIILTNLEWVKKEDFEKPNLVIKDFRVTETEEGIRLVGSISNETLSPVNEVRIFAIFKNEFSNPLGASLTSLNLSPKSSSDFSIFHPPIPDFKKELTAVDFSVRPAN